MIATDTSFDAVRVAQGNAERLGLADRVDVVLRGVDSLAGAEPDERRFDLLLANLPYVSEDEWDELAPEIREYEPREALVAGPTGLEVIEALVEELTAPGDDGRPRSRSRSAPDRPSRSPSWSARPATSEVEIRPRPRRHRACRRRAMTGDRLDRARRARTAARSALERCVGEGGVAVFPADGLYGLACDPLDPEAIERIHSIKGRDDGKPSAVMYFSPLAMRELVSELGRARTPGDRRRCCRAR